MATDLSKGRLPKAERATKMRAIQAIEESLFTPDHILNKEMWCEFNKDKFIERDLDYLFENDFITHLERVPPGEESVLDCVTYQGDDVTLRLPFGISYKEFREFIDAEFPEEVEPKN